MTRTAAPKRRLSRVARIAVLLAIAPTTVVGCAKVTGLAVQADLNVLFLGSAANEVLLAQQVPVLTWPFCSTNDQVKTSYTCKGETMGGQPILVNVTNGTAEDPTMSITIAGKQIYNGSIAKVIAQDARVK